MPRKKKSEEEEGKPDSFTALFLALSIILLAFFILLNTMATLEVKKARAALLSFQGSRDGMGLFGQGVGLSKDTEKTTGEKPDILSMEAVQQMLSQSLSKWGEEKDYVDAYEDERKLVITMKNKALFRVGTEKLNPYIFGLLDQVGAMVKQSGIPLTVEGHSDSSPARGKDSNWVLSARRTIEVWRYLIDGVGVPPSLVEGESFGDKHPLASNDTAEGRSKNRRVDLVFYKNRMPKAEGNR